MAKKKISEIITEENLKKAALKGFAYERALNSAMNAGAPTYRFEVGDKVQVGHLQNCVVDEVLNDGALYLIRSGPNSDNFACWTNMQKSRPRQAPPGSRLVFRQFLTRVLRCLQRSMPSLPR